MDGEPWASQGEQESDPQAMFPLFTTDFPSERKQGLFPGEENALYEQQELTPLAPYARSFGIADYPLLYRPR